MAIRNLRYEGDDILNKKSREIETIDEKLQTLIDDMIDTMHKYNGVGLAAVQVGILKRVFVVDLYDDKGPIVFINPVILKTKGEREVEEGCLSFPNQFAKVIRPAEVVAEYTDRNGKRMRVKAKELFEALKAEGIYVRYCNKPRIDNHLRITIGTDEEMDTLFDFLRTYLKKH